MKTKKSNSVDVVVGRNVRAQRLAAGLSQGALGEQIGVTFQQVQKYEKGVNRIGASRLVRIAKVLNIAIPVLFDGVEPPKGLGSSQGAVGEHLAEPRAMRLAKAFADVSNSRLRLSIVELVERIASRRA
jgi:transcriptional regulator with XRE-family HTH domain